MQYGSNFAKLELAAFYLLRNAKSESDDCPDPFQITNALNDLDKVFHTQFNPMKDMDLDQSPSDIEHIVKKTKMESDMIRGSAYPFQTEEKIRGVQGKFSQFFESKVGISPIKAVDCVIAIGDLPEEKAQPYMERIRNAGKDFITEWKKKPGELIKDESSAAVFGGSEEF